MASDVVVVVFDCEMNADVFPNRSDMERVCLSSLGCLCLSCRVGFAEVLTSIRGRRKTVRFTIVNCFCSCRYCFL